MDSKAENETHGSNFRVPDHAGSDCVQQRWRLQSRPNRTIHYGRSQNVLPLLATPSSYLLSRVIRKLKSQRTPSPYAPPSDVNWAATSGVFEVRGGPSATALRSPGPAEPRSLCGTKNFQVCKERIPMSDRAPSCPGMQVYAGKSKCGWNQRCCRLSIWPKPFAIEEKFSIEFARTPCEEHFANRCHVHLQEARLPARDSEPEQRSRLHSDLDWSCRLIYVPHRVRPRRLRSNGRVHIECRRNEVLPIRRRILSSRPPHLHAAAQQ